MPLSTEPRTEAGRALLAGLSGIATYRPRGQREVVGIRDAILAIEREAFSAGISDTLPIESEAAAPQPLDAPHVIVGDHGVATGGNVWPVAPQPLDLLRRLDDLTAKVRRMGEINDELHRRLSAARRTDAALRDFATQVASLCNDPYLVREAELILRLSRKEPSDE